MCNYIHLCNKALRRTKNNPTNKKTHPKCINESVVHVKEGGGHNGVRPVTLHPTKAHTFFFFSLKQNT